MPLPGFEPGKCSETIKRNSLLPFHSWQTCSSYSAKVHFTHVPFRFTARAVRSGTWTFKCLWELLHLMSFNGLFTYHVSGKRGEGWHMCFEFWSSKVHISQRLSDSYWALVDFLLLSGSNITRPWPEFKSYNIGAEPLHGFNITSLARIQKRAKNILYPSHCVAEHRPNRHGRVGGRWVGRMAADLFTEPLFESSNSISYHVNAARMVHFITSTLPSGQLVVSPLAGRIRSGPQRDTWREQFRKYQGCNNWRLASLRMNYTWQPGPGPWS